MTHHTHGNLFELSAANVGDPRHKLVRNAVYWSVAISSIIAVLKLCAWLFTNSTSLQAAFVDSLMDVIASATAVFAISVAHKPADGRHSFGHSKAESVASIGQTMFVLGSGILLIMEVLEHIFNHEQVKEAETGMWLILISSALLLCLIFIQKYAIKRTKSLLIEAVAVHYKGDIALNFGAIIAVWTSDNFDLPYIDIFFGVSVAIYIFYNAIQVFITAAKDLMDEELPKQLKDQIRTVAEGVPGVKSVARLQTRSAAHKKFIVIEVVVDKTLSLIDADRMVRQVITDIKDAINDSEVTIRPLPG
jgi:ferrous-iron efflux pump FieF